MFSLLKVKNEWEDEKDKCIYYKCINNKPEKYNKSEECICRPVSFKTITIWILIQTQSKGTQTVFK